ncbi:MAG: TonB-dependent receptor, partial [Ferruginibacter sp.]
MKFLTVIFLLLGNFVFAQKNNANISGIVTDDNENPLKGVSIIILGKSTGTASSDSGTFNLKVKPETSLALVFTSTGYNSVQRNFFLSSGEEEVIKIRMTPSNKMLDEVVVTDEKISKESSVIKLNPKSAIAMPSVGGGIETMIKSFVGSNNELTSQYNVRGGNFDENLIYINDFEIYRPYLVSSGQQEGLSFINPALAKNVTFYTGGFQARYGDKLSSVLDIEYKKPTTFSGSAYISLLEQGFHLENKKKNFTYLLGVRNKSNKNVLSNQPTLGSYLPSASDAQAYFTFKVNPKLRFEVLAIYSASRFDFMPESVKKTSSVFSPFYSANLGLDIYFEGQEKDSYTTSIIGISAIQNPTKKLELKWMVSRFSDVEKENLDIAGAYLFGNRDFDNSSTTFGQIVNPLGAGYYQDYARNNLNIESWKAAHKGTFTINKHFIQWGLSAENTKIEDRLKQWQFQDSAGYSIPVNENSLTLKSSVNSTANLSIIKLNAYLQDNIRFAKPTYDLILQAGLRINYNDLNDELLLSPRLQASIKPIWKRDIIFKASAGIYQQPPFYRELRDYDGNLNTNIKAQ